jgi:hypothetical protein
MSKELMLLKELGMTGEDILDVWFEDHPEGGGEICYEFSEEGYAIVVAAAARAGMTMEEYLKRIMDAGKRHSGFLSGWLSSRV